MGSPSSNSGAVNTEYCKNSHDVVFIVYSCCTIITQSNGGKKSEIRWKIRVSKDRREKKRVSNGSRVRLNYRVQHWTSVHRYDINILSTTGPPEAGTVNMTRMERRAVHSYIRSCTRFCWINKITFTFYSTRLHCIGTRTLQFVTIRLTTQRLNLCDLTYYYYCYSRGRSTCPVRPNLCYTPVRTI